MIVKTKEGTIIETHFYSPRGLKRHRYFIDSLEKGVPDPGTPSGLLINELRYREASGLLKKEEPSLVDSYSDEAIGAQEFNDFVGQVETPPALSEEKNPKRKLRTLKRIETLIYDDTAVKQGQLEDEAYELLNRDGFYDEILPIDYEDEAPEVDKKPIKTLLIYLLVLLSMVGIILWWVKFAIL